MTRENLSEKSPPANQLYAELIFQNLSFHLEFEEFETHLASNVPARIEAIVPPGK
jgi:hypothetical protein